MNRTVVAGFAMLALLGGAAEAAHADPITLRAATLAPMRSPWGQVFEAWRKVVANRSNGAMQLQFFYGNQQGDEVEMVGKMRTGQLDGAAITGTGLAQIDRNPLVFELPGLFPDWASLDAVRAKVQPELEKRFAAQGFAILGWGDVGVPHFMTRGFAAHVPADLKHHRVFFLPGDPIAPVMYQTIGDLTPQSLSVPEILPALVAGTCDVVDGPALAAEQLQWTPRLTNVISTATRFEIGAVVFASSRMNGLPADMREILTSSGSNAALALTNRIRKDDGEALARVQQRMTVYQTTPAEEEQWQAMFRATRKTLKTTATFDAKILSMATRD